MNWRKNKLRLKSKSQKERKRKRRKRLQQNPSRFLHGCIEDKNFMRKLSKKDLDNLLMINIEKCYKKYPTLIDQIMLNLSQKELIFVSIL